MFEVPFVSAPACAPEQDRRLPRTPAEPYALHAAGSTDGHEDGRLDLAVRRRDDSRAGVTSTIRMLYLKLHFP